MYEHKIFKFHLGSLPSCIWWTIVEAADWLSFCYTVLTRLQKVESKQLYTVTIPGLQFRLYHVVVPLSFLRIYSYQPNFTVT